MEFTACESEIEELWLGLKHDARQISFASLLSLASSNSTAGAEAAAPSSIFISASGTTFFPQPSSNVAQTTEAIAQFIDGYAFDTRIDAVDEKGTPFVPFVKPLTAREFELLAYGVLLNGTDHTLLLRHESATSVNPAAGRAECKYHDVYLAQLRPVRSPAAILAAERRTQEEAQQQQGGAEEAATATPSAVTVEDLYQPGLVPLFRLRFRRGHDGEADASVGGNDVYYLVSVFVTGHRFGSVHDDTRTMVAHAPNVEYYDRLRADNCDAVQQRQEAWAAWTKYTASSILADPRDGDRARRHGDRTCGFDVEGAGELEEVDEAVLAYAPAASHIATGEDFIPRRCRYPHDRMASRIVVAERATTNRMAQWGAYCAELGLVVSDSADGEVYPDTSRAVRVVWKETRNGTNAVHIDSGELTAFLPSDDEVEKLSVYNTAAEEQLRLWVAKALATAESGGKVRQVLIHADLACLVGRCTGLHSLRSLQSLRTPNANPEDDPIPASISAREHALRVILETAEEWIQTSGSIWRVIVLVDGPVAGDPQGWNAIDVAQDELRLIQRTKGSSEAATPIAPSPTRNAVRQRKPRALAHDDVVTLSPARKGGSVAHGYPRDGDAGIALATRQVTLTDHVILHSSISGVPVSDARLHDLFSRLDVDKKGWLSRSELKRVMLKHTDVYNDVTVTSRGTLAPRRTQDAYLSPWSVLNPLDACGLPFDDAQIDKHLGRFCKQHHERMTYPEFAVMMLELARR